MEILDPGVVTKITGRAFVAGGKPVKVRCVCKLKLFKSGFPLSHFLTKRGPTLTRNHSRF